jgi:hypothetical protein
VENECKNFAQVVGTPAGTRATASMPRIATKSLNESQATLPMRVIKRQREVATSRPVFSLLIGRRIAVSRARGSKPVSASMRIPTIWGSVWT